MLRNALIALIVLQGWMNPLTIVEASPVLSAKVVLEAPQAASLVVSRLYP